MQQLLPRLLVVDDNPGVRDVLRDLLAIEGYPVSTAGGGLSALLRIGTVRPACVILDLKLDDVSGFEIYRVLREEPGFQELPVLFISGAYPDEQWVRRQVGTGPVHYLPKPIIREDLLRAVRLLTAAGTPEQAAAC
jgi:CheY-like chemotaxis protein